MARVLKQPADKAQSDKAAKAKKRPLVKLSFRSCGCFGCLFFGLLLIIFLLGVSAAAGLIDWPLWSKLNFRPVEPSCRINRPTKLSWEQLWQAKLTNGDIENPLKNVRITQEELNALIDHPGLQLVDSKFASWRFARRQICVTTNGLELFFEPAVPVQTQILLLIGLENEDQDFQAKIKTAKIGSLQVPKLFFDVWIGPLIARQFDKIVYNSQSINELFTNIVFADGFLILKDE